jgi:hypothetical protein
MCIYGLLVVQLVYFLSIKFLTFDKKKKRQNLREAPGCGERSGLCAPSRACILPSLCIVLLPLSSAP